MKKGGEKEKGILLAIRDKEKQRRDLQSMTIEKTEGQTERKRGRERERETDRPTDRRTERENTRCCVGGLFN